MDVLAFAALMAATSGEPCGADTFSFGYDNDHTLYRSPILYGPNPPPNSKVTLLHLLSGTDAKSFIELEPTVCVWLPFVSLLSPASHEIQRGPNP